VVDVEMTAPTASLSDWWLVIALAGAGTITLAGYLRFRWGAARRSEQNVARFASLAGAPTLPLQLLPGSWFWFAAAISMAFAQVDGRWALWAAAAFGVAALGSAGLGLVWAINPPAWVVPDWYRDVVEDHIARRSRIPLRKRLLGVLTLATSIAVGGVALLAFRFDNSPLAAVLTPVAFVLFARWVWNSPEQAASPPPDGSSASR
jgi:hypothetical protein